MAMAEGAEDAFPKELGGEEGEGAVVPQSFISVSVHGTYGAYFTELQSELSKAEEAAGLPPFLQKKIPLPLLFVDELSRRQQVNSVARDSTMPTTALSLFLSRLSIFVLPASNCSQRRQKP